MCRISLQIDAAPPRNVFFSAFLDGILFSAISYEETRMTQTHPHTGTFRLLLGLLSVRLRVDHFLRNTCFMSGF